MNIEEHELDILEQISQHAERVHQRDLARIAGLSLGMTNTIIKRLAQKGWLTIRKVNNRNIRYAVSPAGIRQIARRSYRYFKRTVKNIVYYREAIERFVRGVKAEGYRSLVLFGKSDLDFIVQHACSKLGIEYVRDALGDDTSRGKDDGVFTLYAEGYLTDGNGKRARPATAFIRDVIGEAEKRA